MLICIESNIRFINKETTKLQSKTNLFKTVKKQILNNIANLFALIYILAKVF